MNCLLAEGATQIVELVADMPCAKPRSISIQHIIHRQSKRSTSTYHTQSYSPTRFGGVPMFLNQEERDDLLFKGKLQDVLISNAKTLAQDP